VLLREQQCFQGIDIVGRVGEIGGGNPFAAMAAPRAGTAAAPPGGAAPDIAWWRSDQAILGKGARARSGHDHVVQYPHVDQSFECLSLNVLHSCQAMRLGHGLKA